MTDRKIYKRPKLVRGHGINDANYPTTPWINGKQIMCPFYNIWSNMFNRVYSAHRPTYIGTSICEEWHTFSKFKKWMESQDWEGNDLDKDIIKPGNKIYSPETCCFVSHALNSLLSDSAHSRGEYPIGVSYHKRDKKYRARYSDGKTTKWLGSFNTPSAAHSAWVKAKTNLISSLAVKQTDFRITNGLMRHAALAALRGLS